MTDAEHDMVTLVLVDPGARFSPGILREKKQRGFRLVSSDHAELWVHENLLTTNGDVALMARTEAEQCGLEDGCHD